MKKDEPPLDFPDTLEGFEYAFNEKGQLRHIKTGEPFVFNYREDLHRWNQKRYEALGEIITKYVYELLEKDCNLKKISIPVDATESEPKSFIFMSEDALTNPQKLMVLIHGSGVVRAGQWARRLIINEDLDSGTQIPFIKRAVAENGSPEEHAVYVWDHFIAQAAAENVFFVAHSYGGLAFVELMIQREADVKNKVTAVALTDSVHNVWHQEAGKTIREWMRENCCNWVSSSEPLDTSVESMLPDCPRVSADTDCFVILKKNSMHRPSRANFLEELPVYFQILYRSLRSQDQLPEAGCDAPLAPHQARRAVRGASATGEATLAHAPAPAPAPSSLLVSSSGLPAPH
ncbi:cotranscriptional regulator FAM172A isoform X13 [Trachypithecus francoisi]|nr:cotranscriptional regulator FAM172A isoform X13 [Trachypithecus francoisi]